MSEVANKRPVITVIGAGAVGAYYGGRLALHGHNVHFLLRRDYETVRRNGWTIRSCDGDFTLAPGAIRVYPRPEEMPKADLVIVTLKTTTNDRFAELITPLFKENTIILTMQNGLGNEERLAELFGRERILGGIAFVCINRIEAGVVHHMSEGLVRIGEMSGPATPRVREIVEMFSASKIDCRAVDDLRKARWQKLIWNVPFNGLGAALNLTTDQLLASADGAKLVGSLMREVIDAAAAMGMEFPLSMIDQQIEFTRPMGPYRTSMQVDRETGRAMEVEAILGEPMRQAQRFGIPVPRLEMLYRMVGLGNLGKL